MFITPAFITPVPLEPLWKEIHWYIQLNIFLAFVSNMNQWKKY
jgi:hypothetical protein